MEHAMYLNLKIEIILIESRFNLPIVGCREDGDAFSIMSNFVSISLDFMTADNIVQMIPL